MKRLQKTVALLWFVCLTLIGCGGGGSGAGVVFNPGDKNTASPSGRLTLQLPGVPAARLATKVPPQTTGFLVRLTLVENWGPVLGSPETPVLEKAWPAKPEAQVVEVLDIRPGVWMAEVQAGRLNPDSTPPGLTEVYAQRTVYFAVNLGKTVDVPVKLGFGLKNAQVTPATLSFEQGELISLENPTATAGILTISTGGLACGLTLAQTGFLACPAQAGGYTITAGSTVLVSASVNAGSKPLPPGVGVFRTLLSLGQAVDLLAFGGSAAGGELLNVDWGDGSAQQATSGQRLFHFYADPGYYVIAVSSKSAVITSPLQTFVAVAVRELDPDGAHFFIRPGAPLAPEQFLALGFDLTDLPDNFAVALSEAGNRTLLSVHGLSPLYVGIAPLSGAADCASANFLAETAVDSLGQKFCVKLGSKVIGLEVVSQFRPLKSATDGITAELGLRVISGLGQSAQTATAVSRP